MNRWAIDGCTVFYPTYSRQPLIVDKQECWTISLQVTRRDRVVVLLTDVDIVRTRDQWGSSKKTGTRKTLHLNIGKFKFPRYFMRKDGLRNWILSVCIECSWDREKRWATYAMSLCKWMAEERKWEMLNRQMLVRCSMDKKLSKTMMNHVLKGHCTEMIMRLCHIFPKADEFDS